MKLKKGFNNSEECVFLLLTAAIAMTVFAVAFSLVGMAPGREHIFLSGDLYLEYAAVNRLFWRNLLNGESVTYSFSMGMGMPAFSTYAYDCFSPIHILFALISDADLAAFVVVMIKTGISAMTFYLYAGRCLKSEKMIASMLGICYSMCGYTIGSICQIAFLDAVYLLPILALLLKRAIVSEKYILPALVYAYSFATMFYTGYMLGLFTAMLFLMFLGMQQGLNRKERLHHLIKYAMTALTGMLLSAVVTVPTAIFLFSNQPEDATLWHRPAFHIWDLIANLYMGQFQGYNGQVPLIYCGIGTIYALIAGGLSAKRPEKKHLFCLVPGLFLLLCVFVKPFYLMIHAFDMPDTFMFRFTYMVSFLFLSAAAYYLPLKINRRRGILTALLISGSYFAIYYLEKILKTENVNGMSIEAGVLNMLFLVLWAIVLTNTRKNKRWQYLIVMLAAIEMCLNAYLMHHPDEDAYSRSRVFYEQWNKEGMAVAEGLAQDTEDAGAFRVFYENVMFLNDSAYFGYHGLGYFFSAEQPLLRKALTDLGYASSVRSVCDYGSTPVTRMLFAQRYLVHGTDLRYETTDAFSVQKNPYVLPMAYMVSEDLLEYAPGEDPFVNQDLLIAHMRGDEGMQMYHPVQGEIAYEENGICLSETEAGYKLEKEADAESGYGVYRVPAQDGKQVCTYFAPVIKGWWHDSAYLFSPLTDIGGLGWDPFLSLAHIIPLGQNENGESEVNITMTPGTTSEQEYKKAYFDTFDTEAFINNYEALIPGAAQIEAFSEGFMRCRVNVTEDKTLMFTSIPNDKGWEVLVDGQKTETVSVVEGAFLALLLSSGEHEVVLHYCMPGVALGVTGSIAGFGILLLWILGMKHNFGRKNDREK